MDWQKIAEAVVCFLKNIFYWLKDEGYGDPDNSTGNDTATGADFTLVCNSGSTSCVLILQNNGGFEIEVACNTTSPRGFRIPVNSFRIVDKARGVIYARSTGGASSLNWYILAKNQRYIST